ncbi:MAG: hypothetical protein ACLGHN_15220 [Bacteriovoracia bacterium]
MGLILWIDENTFATGLLEKVFKKKNLPFYTLMNATDFIYLVDDLKPELLVLDSATAAKYAGDLERQFQQSEALRSLPVIFVDEVSGLDFIRSRRGVIKRPFDPFQIPQKLEEILKVN